MVFHKEWPNADPMIKKIKTGIDILFIIAAFGLIAFGGTAEADCSEMTKYGENLNNPWLYEFREGHCCGFGLINGTIIKQCQ